MADIFGNQELFSEFEKTTDRSDRILMSKLIDESPSEKIQQKNGKKVLEDDEPVYAVGFSSDSDSSDSVSDVEGVLGTTRTRTRSRRHVPETTEKNGEHNSDSDDNQGVGKLIDPVQGVSELNNSQLLETVKKLETELRKVKRERDRLKKIARVINPSKYVKNEEGPTLQMVYMNTGTACKYRQNIENFLTNLARDKHTLNDKTAQMNVTKSAVCLEDQNEEVRSTKEKLLQIKTSMVIGCSQFFAEFVIDAMGWPLTSDNPSVSEGWDLPLYEQVYFTALPLEEDESAAKKDKRPKATCFNCGENHTIKDCPAPHNYAKIAENRRKFQTTQPKQTRSIGDDPKYAKFKAGHISESLKDAMGLSKNQLPSYIYQMRVLGYPPGHLQALTQQSSGLAMFDKHGKEVGSDGTSTEEGEVEANAPIENINVKNIISYPGFNVNVGSDYIDDSKRLGMPEMNHSQSREMMVQMLTGNKAVKRTHSDSSTPRGRAPKKMKTQKNPTTEDMDLSDGEVDPKSSIKERLARADTEILSQSSPASTVSSEAMTLEDLEQQKLLLKQQLALSEGTDADIQVLDSCDSQDDERSQDEGKSQDGERSQDSDCFVPPLPPTPVRPPLPTNTPPRTPTTPSQALTCGSQFKTPDGQPRLLRTPSSGGSRSMSLGTPITENSNGDARTKGLPEPSKFAEGIAQHIPFENLPGSTGTFERMKGLLDRIRTQRDESS